MTVPLRKYLSDNLYHYTNYGCVFRLRLVAISLFVTYCIRVSSSDGCVSSFCKNFLILIFILFIQFICIHDLLIRHSDDTEMNPGLMPNLCHNLSICRWNLNSLTAHNYINVSRNLLKSIKKFHVVYLSETFLNLSYLPDDDNFDLPGYNIVRADCPSDTKIVAFASISKTLFLNDLDIQLLRECMKF